MFAQNWIMAKLRRLLPVVTALVAIGSSAVTLSVASAPSAEAATYAIYQTTAALSARNAPTASSTNVYGAPAGARISVQCQVIRQPVGPRGNTLYFWVSYAARNFYVPDTWTNSPHHAGQPPITGIPMCGSTAAPSPCYAASCAGKNPVSENCVSGARYLDTYRAWAPGGEVAAYVELFHSDHCGSAWLFAVSPQQDTEGTTSSIWNPNGPSYSVQENMGVYVNSAMVDDVPSMTTCLGTQVYYLGKYYQWQFHICY